MFRLLLSYLLGGVAAGLFSVILVFFSTRLLSTEAYAIGMMFKSLTSILFIFCNAGMDLVFMRFFYEKKYKKNLPLLLYRCLLIVFSFFILVSIILYFFCGELLQWLSLDSPMMVLCLFIGMILVTLLRFSQLIPRLRENSLVYNLANVAFQVFFLFIFVVIFYFITKGYWAIIISQLITMILVITGLVIYYKEELIFSQGQNHAIFDAKEFKEFLTYGIPGIFSQSLFWLFVNLDKFIILKLSNYHMLGIYTAAFELAEPLVFVQSIFLTAWAPRMNHMLIYNPFKSKKIFYVTFEKLSFTLTCFFLVLVLLKNYLVLFIGPNFHQAVNIFPWLLFAPYFGVLSEVVFAGIVKSKKSYWHMYISLTTVFVNITGCYLLIPYVGGRGAAISVAISFGIYFIARWIIAFRYYTFKIKRIKLITYISFICIFILFSDIETLKYPLLVMMLVTAVILEREWLYYDVMSAMNSLFAQYNTRVNSDIFQKSS